MSANKRILFVDDEANILNGLKRMLHRMRDEWDMEFVTSGDDALTRMAEQEFDVIVSDMRMPGMNGAQLLQKIQAQYPGMVRLILSGYSDQELVLRSVGPAHQFLAKPCNAEMLRESIQRSCSLRQYLNDHVVRDAIGTVDSLPVLPSVYTDLLTALADEDATLADVGTIIGRDLGLSAKILQLVNSSFFGIPQRVDTPARAAMFLGLDTIKSLVLLTSVFSSFRESLVSEFSIEQLQRHSLAVGSLAKTFAEELGLDQPTAEDAFCAGLLHDVGKLILISNFPEKLREVMTSVDSTNRLAIDVEDEIVDTNHAQLGGYLLGLWGMPDPVVEAVALHARPELSPNTTVGPLALVHLADQFDHEYSSSPSPASGAFDEAYIERIGLTSRLDSLKTLAKEQLSREDVLAGAEG